MRNQNVHSFLKTDIVALRVSIIAVAIVCGISIGCGTHKVQFEKLTPAEINIEGIKRVAVADFDGLEQSGKIVAAKVAEGIVDAGHYKLFEREKLAQILEEREFSQSEIVAPQTASQLKLMGVDALIFGVVDVYNVDEQTGVSKIEKKIGTGEYRIVEKKNPKTGVMEQVQEEIMKTVFVDRGYIIREGTIGVTYRMANINTGEIVAVEAETANFSRRAWQDEAEKLPSKDAILDQLSSEVVRQFLHKIQPRYVERAIELESHKDPYTEMGIKYARAGLWDKAEEAFQKAAQFVPGQAKTHYNLAMAYSVRANYAQAISELEQAIALDPEDKYIHALAKLRQDASDAELLDKQTGGLER